jgi:hypothetical protein
MFVTAVYIAFFPIRTISGVSDGRKTSPARMRRRNHCGAKRRSWHSSTDRAYHSPIPAMAVAACMAAGLVKGVMELVEKVTIIPSDPYKPVQLKIHGRLATLLEASREGAIKRPESLGGWLRGLATIVVYTLTTQSFERQCNMHTSAFSPSERTEPTHASSLGGSNTASQVRQTEAGVLPSRVIRLRCFSRSIRPGFQKKL